MPRSRSRTSASIHCRKLRAIPGRDGVARHGLAPRAAGSRPRAHRPARNVEGGEFALLAASREPRIRATAAIAPSAYVWFDLARRPRGDVVVERRRRAGGVHSGRSGGRRGIGRAFATSGAISFRDTFAASYAAASPAVRARAAIPVEKIAGPVLCIAGERRPRWDSSGACAIVHDRRHATSRDAKDEAMVEPGAGHALPFSGKPAPRSYPAGPATIVLGGTPEANGRGGADARDRVIAFFNRTLGGL